jgi:hypothetical protein
MYTCRFTGLEFEILWAAYGRDRLPYPLWFRPDATDFDDLKRQREAAVEALLGKHAIELERALEILLDPEVRVESKGFGRQGSDDTYRFHGAIRDHDGATLRQLAGTAPDIGGDVIIGYCTASQVAEQAVDALPKTRAGTRPPIEVRREEITADRERHVRQAYEVSIVAQLDRIFKRERLGLGEITVFAGPAVDSRPAFGRGFWWMDYDDGRYYVQTGDPIVARPMDAATMSAEIRNLATLTQRYYREDREHDEYLRSQR